MPGAPGKHSSTDREIAVHARRPGEALGPPDGRAAREAMKSGAPGRAPGRPALPSSQTGRLRAARSASAPGDGPACGRPGRARGPCRRVAREADGPAAGGAGERRWGRPAMWRAPEAAGEPPRARLRSRTMPRPASRTRVPFPRHRAPARGASACSVDGWSARGTCVRERYEAGRTERAKRGRTHARDLALARRKTVIALQRHLQTVLPSRSHETVRGPPRTRRLPRIRGPGGRVASGT